MKVLLMIALIFSGVAFAMPITVSFVSGDGTATSSTGAVYNVTPHPLWGVIPGASWVSAYDNTGNGEGFTLPNSGGAPSYTFTQGFYLPFSENTGIGTFGADDTMGIWLNGQLVKAPNFTLDSACADKPVGCEPDELLTISLSQFLVQGNNVLKLDVYQLGSSVTGAVWEADFTSANPVPEPSTLTFLGLGLIGMALAHCRRKQRG